jgi:hypothetical protein
MTKLEQEMRAAGFVRSPTNEHRWYAACSASLGPVFPLDIRVTDAIWIVTARYGKTINEETIPLLKFDRVEQLTDYLKTHGKPRTVEGGNVWD